MRILRCLLAMAMVAALSGVAKADDFQTVVIDPQPSPSEVHLITSTTFAVTLSPCQSNQLDGFSTTMYLGCFTGLNDTGKTLTSLELLIPVFDLNGSQDTAGCALVGGGKDVFPTPPTCGLTGNKLDYFVQFSGGDLPTSLGVNGDCDKDGDGGKGLNGDDITCDLPSIFTIAVGIGKDCGSEETCASDTEQIDDGFNQGTIAIANATPEPNSLLLLSTGVLSIGMFGAYRRRKVLLRARL